MGLALCWAKMLKKIRSDVIVLDAISGMGTDTNSITVVVKAHIVVALIQLF